MESGAEAHGLPEHGVRGAVLLGAAAVEDEHGAHQEGELTATEIATVAVAAAAKRLRDEEQGLDDEGAKRLRGEAGHAGGGDAMAGTAAEAGSFDPAMAAAIAAAAAAMPVHEGQLGDDAAAATAAAAQQLLMQHGGVLPLDASAAAALGLSPEQQAQMLVQMQLPMLSPEALAAAAQHGGEAGAPLDAAALAAHAAGAGGAAVDPAFAFPVLGPDGAQLTNEQLVQLFSSSQMPFVIPLPGGGQPLPGEALLAGDAVYKNWWDEKDEKELVALVEDPSYRLQKLGAEELDWDRVAAHFGGRSQNALRKKYWTLTKRQAADSDGDALELTAVDPNKRPRADRKLWSDEEAHQLMRLVMEPLFRSHMLHLDESASDPEMWEAIAVHFACSVQTAKRKYRHTLEAMQNGTMGQEKGKRQHHRKATPYRWMIVAAMGELPSTQGTAPDIFERIEANPAFAEQLDQRIMPGTKHVPRWKIQVRKVLSADKIFQHTGLKQKHETVWRLDQLELQQAQSSSRNANRTPLAPAAPLPQPYDAPTDAPDPAAGAAAAAAAMGAGQPGFTAAELAAMQHPQAAVDPAVAAQMQVQAMQDQIAAVMAAAPLAVPPDQLPQLAELGMQGIDPGVAAALEQMQAAAAGGGAGGHADPGGGGHEGAGQEAQHAHHSAQHGLAPALMGFPAGLDAAALSALSAGGHMGDSPDPAALTLPLVHTHTVEVPAPLEDGLPPGG